MLYLRLETRGAMGEEGGRGGRGANMPCDETAEAQKAQAAAPFYTYTRALLYLHTC